MGSPEGTDAEGRPGGRKRGRRGAGLGRDAIAILRGMPQMMPGGLPQIDEARAIADEGAGGDGNASGNGGDS